MEVYRIADDIRISGAVSMDEEGNLAAVDDLEQQMKNVYADLGKVLKHHGCTFDDVIVENVFTTRMAEFLEVKELALPEFMIEIERQARRPG